MTESAAAPRPGPMPENLLDQEFWANCSARKLCFQRCKSCKTWRHLPRLMCASCGSPQWEWQESSGRGHIYTWTVTHQAMLPAFAAETPYAAVIVELEEGVRMVSGVQGIALDEIEIDLPVEVTFMAISEDTNIPVFRHRGQSAQQ